MFGTQKRKEESPKLEPPLLQVKRNGRVISQVPLSPDESVFAGTSATCKVELFGEEVGSFHCLFCFNEEQLMVNNCGHSTVTLVNGQPLDGEQTLAHGDEVVVGATTIVPVLKQDADFCVTQPEVDWPESLSMEPQGEAVAPGVRPDDPSTEPGPAEIAGDTNLDTGGLPETGVSEPDLNAPSTGEPEVDDLDASELSASENPTSQTHSVDEPIDPQPTSEATESDEGHVEWAAADDWDADNAADELDDPTDDNASFVLDDDVRQEMELLRSEIEYLRCEIEEKDALLADHRDVEPSSDHPAEEGSVNETEVNRLVNRLEELLVELQHSDERVTALNDQLRAAEHANEAEREERHQLESWLNEIESRVAQREEEMEAELQRFRKKWKEEQQQRGKAEKQLKKLMSRKTSEAGGQPDAATEAMWQDKLRQENRAAESLRQENDELKEQLRRLQQDDQSQQVSQLQQKLAEMELESSRERAEIARQRVELEQVREELQRKAQQEANGEVESRITAMRQHLREIYEEEKTVEMERKQNSLSGRISRLLGRL